MIDRFYNSMDSMTTSAIISAIRDTWNMPEGEIFREVGFEILENRLGEDECDEIYAEIWHQVR